MSSFSMGRIFAMTSAPNNNDVGQYGIAHLQGHFRGVDVWSLGRKPFNFFFDVFKIWIAYTAGRIDRPRINNPDHIRIAEFTENP